jgi:hypothetical protein
MKIGVITIYDRHYDPVTEVTFPVVRSYCKSHGYLFKSVYSQPESWAEAVWEKIPVLRDHLQYFDWLMWIDADAMVMNHTIRLERLIDSAYENAHLIISRDENGLNAGVFLLKNCDDSMKFLEEVDSKKSEFISRRYPEQEAMQDCLRYLGTAYVPTWVLNQFWCTWMPGDFIIHHAGGSVEDKVKGLTPFLEKVQYVTK